jgi:Dolichyl-phosphate-mannose-protein mannosyltransferase
VEQDPDFAQRLARIADPGSPQAVAMAAAFLLTLYVGLALAYRDAIPLFEAPDEPSHMHYAAFVAARNDLPRQDPLDVPGEGMQPPLVYVLAAPLLDSRIDAASAVRELGRAMFPLYSHPRAEGGGPAIAYHVNGIRMFTTNGSLEPLRVLRSTSLVFGLLTVILTFAAVWRLSRDARFALLGGALVAFNPQFLYGSGYFSNDPAAAAIGAAALWVVVRALEDAGRAPLRRHYVVGAVVIALGVLTKSSTLPGLAAAAVTLVAIDPRPRREAMTDTGIAAALVLGLAGPYLLWANEARGGPFGLGATLASSVSMMRPERFGGLWAYFTGLYWDATFESYWARFGWFNVTVPNAVYLAFFALTWMGVLGWLAGRSREPWEALRSRAIRIYLFGAFGTTLAAHVALNFVVVSVQGRQLFAVAPQAALLLALGIYRLIGGKRRLLSITTIVVLALLALDVYCLRSVLVPAYRVAAG